MFKCGKLRDTGQPSLVKNAFLSSCDKIYVFLLQSTKLILQLTNDHSASYKHGSLHFCQGSS